MINLRIAAIITVSMVFVVSDAVASPGAFLMPTKAKPSLITPVGNGYGPIPNGLYGDRHRFRAKRDYGTGYRGRGTKTGGPAGGLPGRS